MKSFLLYLIPIGILVAGAGVYYAKSQDEAGGKKKWGGGAAPVFVSVTEMKTFTEKIEALGTVKANESTLLSSKVTGIIQSIHFEEGEQVPQGKELVHLETEQEEAILREAKAILQESESQLKRVQQLEPTGGISQSSIDEARSAYEAALARVQSLQSQIKDHQLTAPFAGVLGLRNVSVGSLVRPGDAVISIMDISKVKLDFTVPEIHISLLKTGQPISATSMAYPDKIFNGTVRSIDSEINEITRAITVRAELDNNNRELLPGMLMTVELATIERESISIPESALVPVGGKQYVFKVNEENIAQRILVTIGNRYPGHVEVLDGLALGDLVITEGFRARHGKPVEIKKEEDVFAQKK